MTVSRSPTSSGRSPTARRGPGASRGPGRPARAVARRLRRGGRAAPGDRRRRPRALGPRGPPPRDSRCGGCSAPGEPLRHRRQRHRSPPPTGPEPPPRRARRARPATARSRSRSASATTPAGSPRSAPPPGPGSRSGSTPTAPGRSTEALATLAGARTGRDRALRGALPRPRGDRHGRGERSPVAIALDESARLPGALDRRRADAVCLKISSCGGITGLLAAAGRARAAGYEVYLGSTFDGPLGIAAALHAAAAIGPDRPCGLATLAAFGGPGEPAPGQRRSACPAAGPGARGRARGLVRLTEQPDGAACRAGADDGQLHEHRPGLARRQSDLPPSLRARPRSAPERAARAPGRRSAARDRTAAPSCARRRARAPPAGADPQRPAAIVTGLGGGGSTVRRWTVVAVDDPLQQAILPVNTAAIGAAAGVVGRQRHRVGAWADCTGGSSAEARRRCRCRRRSPTRRRSRCRRHRPTPTRRSRRASGTAAGEGAKPNVACGLGATATTP